MRIFKVFLDRGVVRVFSFDFPAALTNAVWSTGSLAKRNGAIISSAVISSTVRVPRRMQPTPGYRCSLAAAAHSISFESVQWLLEIQDTHRRRVLR